MANYSHREVLQYYRDAGFLVALDDLGSGYSSLNLLHQLRPDFIKLDMELIRNVHQDLYKASITEKLLEIAQKLDIKTVAEGIECIEELNWLRERGATFAQGYLIAKPNAVPVTTTPHFDPIALTLASTDRKQVEWHVQHQSESERIVAAVTQRIRQSLELDEILQTTAAEVRQLFEVDRVVIYQFEPDWSGLVAVESLAEGCMSIFGFHSTDLVARYGGEEFAVILPNTDIEGAIAVAKDIQNNVSALKMPHSHSHASEFITLSLGVATITPHSQLSPATLIAAADQGLYQAKAQGRNCVVQMDCKDTEVRYRNPV